MDPGVCSTSCLDFRAARRDTVHTSCPCPHPREHTPITSKEFERVKKKVKREREICAQCEKTVIPRNRQKKKEDYEKTNREGTPALDCMLNVCGWKEYTKI